MLVAQITRHRHAAQRPNRIAIHLAGGANLRQHAARDAQRAQDFVVPV